MSENLEIPTRASKAKSSHLETTTTGSGRALARRVTARWRKVLRQQAAHWGCAGGTSRCGVLPVFPARSHNDHDGQRVPPVFSECAPGTCQGCQAEIYLTAVSRSHETPPHWKLVGILCLQQPHAKFLTRFRPQL